MELQLRWNNLDLFEALILAMQNDPLKAIFDLGFELAVLELSRFFCDLRRITVNFKSRVELEMDSSGSLG